MLLFINPFVKIDHRDSKRQASPTAFKARRSGERQSHRELFSNISPFHQEAKIFPEVPQQASPISHWPDCVTLLSLWLFQFQRLTRPGAREEMSFFEHISAHLIAKQNRHSFSSEEKDVRNGCWVGSQVYLPLGIASFSNLRRYFFLVCRRWFLSLQTQKLGKCCVNWQKL